MNHVSNKFFVMNVNLRNVLLSGRHVEPIVNFAECFQQESYNFFDLFYVRCRLAISDRQKTAYSVLSVCNIIYVLDFYMLYIRAIIP